MTCCLRKCSRVILKFTEYFAFPVCPRGLLCGLFAHSCFVEKGSEKKRSFHFVVLFYTKGAPVCPSGLRNRTSPGRTIDGLLWNWDHLLYNLWSFFSEGKTHVRSVIGWDYLCLYNEFQAFNQIRLSGEHIYWFVENPGHSTRMIFIYTDSWKYPKGPRIPRNVQREEYLGAIKIVILVI